MTNPLGTSPLGYQGLKETDPPDQFFRSRAPNINDVKLYDIGDLWQNTASLDFFRLVAKSKNITTGFIEATWVLISIAAGDVQTLTGDVGAAVNPVAGNINVQGGAAGAIEFSNGGAGQLDAQVLVDGVTISIVGNQLVATGGGLLTLSAEGGASTAPDGAGNFDFSGTALGAIIFSTPAVGLMDATVQVDNTTIQINASNQLEVIGGSTATVDTIGAVTASLFVQTLIDPQEVMLEAEIIGRRLDAPYTEGLWGKLIFGARRVGGAAILIGTPIVDFGEDYAGAPTFTGDVSGNDARIRVTGTAGVNIRWVGRIHVLTA